MQTFTCVEFDEMSCTFSNGDELIYSDCDINLTNAVTLANGITGYALSFDFFDSETNETWVNMELFQSINGSIYELYSYFYNLDNGIELCDVLIGTKELAHCNIYGGNADFWRAIHKAIRQI